MELLIADDINITEKIQKGDDITVSFKFIDEANLLKINAILLKILSRQGNVFLLETLITIIREIIFNAFKANLKRIYFEKSGVSINDTEKYDELMCSFKDDFLYNLDEIRSDILTQNRYHISVTFSRHGREINFSVFNNVTIIEEEFKRIRDRIEQSKNFQNLADAYNDVYDSTEGAGLGLVLMIFLLRNSGIGADNLTINHNDKGVTVSIFIPEQLKDHDIVSDVKGRILKDVESLPTFPENIIELQRLCKEKNATIDAISERISRDPSLTADVIKLSNSAGFVPGKKIVTIKDAVKIIGLKNLNLILTASATRKILDNKYKKFEVIWEHCIRVAYYAREIAKKKGLGVLADSAFISGLLHDIGKIVLLSADPNIVNIISEITKNKQMRSSSILEEISIGVSHAEIGGLIAHKWNFPADLTRAIEFHHSPLNVETDYKILTWIVYTANMLCGVESNKYSYYYLETDILKWLKIRSLEEIKNFHEKIKDNYLNHLSLVG
ncbi:MAG TPA: HDOD domain-containing protein [Spirochaetota bacterium]|nr:HDOD domain-containing protein [Spirochaetota bacterium]